MGPETVGPATVGPETVGPETVAQYIFWYGYLMLGEIFTLFFVLFKDTILSIHVTCA